jgi:hypothetical protein
MKPKLGDRARVAVSADREAPPRTMDEALGPGACPACGAPQGEGVVAEFGCIDCGYRQPPRKWWERCWPANECPPDLRHLSAFSKQTCALCNIRFRPDEREEAALSPLVGWACSWDCLRDAVQWYTQRGGKV